MTPWDVVREYWFIWVITVPALALVLHVMYTRVRRDHRADGSDRPDSKR